MGVAGCVDCGGGWSGSRGATSLSGLIARRAVDGPVHGVLYQCRCAGTAFSYPQGLGRGAPVGGVGLFSRGLGPIRVAG